MEGIPAFSWFIKNRWPQKIVSRVRWIWDILDANVHLTALLSEKKCKKKYHEIYDEITFHKKKPFNKE